MKWSYEATRAGYARMWASIRVKGGTDAANAKRCAQKIIAAKGRYKAVEDTTGVPWFFLGALHMRESSGNFAGVLHNGERIIGTRRKTKLVPRGRGPFKTWESAAIDAIKYMKLDKVRDWSAERAAYQAELYNGLGYQKRGVNSPYLWAGSNHEQRGAYIRDHVWDKNADDKRIGVMTVLRVLADMDKEVATVIGKPVSTQKKVVVGGTVAGGVVVGGAVANDVASEASSTLDQLMPIVDIITTHGTTIALVFTVAVVVGAVAWHFWQKKQEADATA